MTTQKTKLAILLKSSTDPISWSSFGPQLRVSATFVKMTDEGIRNPSDSSYDDAEVGFADLEISGTMDALSVRNEEADRPAHLYGSGPEYRRPFSVDMRRAKAMASTLARIERGEAKLTERFGYPSSFGERLTRIADALGVTTFLVRQGDSPTDGSYDSMVFDTRTPSDAINWVENAERKFRETLAPATAEA